MFNYTKISDMIQSRKDLSSTSKLIYSDLAFKMRLSFHNGDSFYDQRHGYYTVYKITDLAKKAGCGKNAVIRALKLLESKNLISRIRRMHYTRIFMPKLTKSQVETQQTPESKPVKIIKNHKTKKSNTSNTINTKNRKKSHKLIKKTRTTKPKLQSKHQKPRWSSNDNNAIETELLNQRLGLPKAAAEEIIKDAGEDYYQVGHVMINAKRQARNYIESHTKHEYNYRKPLNRYYLDRAFRFEGNNYFKGRNNDATSHASWLDSGKGFSERFGSLANQIRRGLWKAVHKIIKPNKKYRTVFAARMAYFAKSMQRYLSQAGLSYVISHCKTKDDYAQHDTDLPRIPLDVFN